LPRLDEEAVMELIDWSLVLTVVAAGVILVSGAWALVVLGAVCSGYRRRSIRWKAGGAEEKPLSQFRHGPPAHPGRGSLARPGEKVVDFTGVCASADALYPVTGSILCFAPGEVGAFSFALRDTSPIKHGPATLTIAGGECWSISILETVTALGGCGQSTFRVEGISP
jgi:hypothetical protein